MKPIKRKKHITYPQFCSVFPNRKFNKRDKLMRKIFMIEDVDGNYRIEEKITLLGCTVMVLLIMGASVGILLLRGLYGLGEFYTDEVKPFLNGEPLRIDECKHNIKSTAQLLEFTGWCSS